jgi:hypothetical protein
MFSKASLTYLVLGALYVNALSVPVARSPAPEPEPEMSQDIDARVIPFLPAIAAGLLGSAAGSFFRPKRELSDDLFAREPQFEGSQEVDDRALNIPAIAAGLTGIAAAAPLLSFFKGKREAESDVQELDARFSPLILPALSAASALLPFIPGYPKGKRDLEGEGQELDARVLPLLPLLGAGLLGAAGSFFKPKRELSDELFAREPQSDEIDDRAIPFSAITTGLSLLGAVGPLIPKLFGKDKRELEELLAREDFDDRAIPFSAITTGLSVLGAVTPLIPKLFGKDKRELEELLAREDFDDRALNLPAITAGLAALGAITPHIPAFFGKNKREISDELFSREPEDWNQWAEAVRDQAAKREPSPDPLAPFPFLRRPTFIGGPFLRPIAGSV